MSSSTTNGARQAPSAWCCWSASSSFSSSSAGSFRSTAYWDKNEEFLARPHRLRRLLRAGAALPDLAGADHCADVVLEHPLPDLPAAVAVAALVPGIYRQYGLDAGDPRHLRGCGAHRIDCNAARRRRGLRHQQLEATHHATDPYDADAALGGADHHHRGRHLLRLCQGRTGRDDVGT